MQLGHDHRRPQLVVADDVAADDQVAVVDVIFAVQFPGLVSQIHHAAAQVGRADEGVDLFQRQQRRIALRLVLAMNDKMFPLVVLRVELLGRDRVDHVGEHVAPGQIALATLVELRGRDASRA
jgi:hypothetical protein